jgi:hypothetical protein
VNGISLVWAGLGERHSPFQWFAVVLVNGIGLFNGLRLCWTRALVFSMVCDRFGEWYHFDGLRSFWKMALICSTVCGRLGA